jgi:hypothetical protein
VERLERRALLAGDVRVFLDPDGNMIVVGDAAANGIQLDQFGDFVIQGIDAGGAPTRVNGVENGIAVFEVTGEDDIRIRLRGGADVLEVGVRSDSVSTPDDLEIDGGSGSDSVLTIGDTNIGDDLIIAGGSGHDSVFIVSTQVVHDVTVNTGDGDDKVEIYGSDIGDDLLISTGAGRDTVSLGLFNGPGGRVEGAINVADNTDIDLGAGNDSLEIVGSIFHGKFRADGGRGTDTLINTANTFARRPGFHGFEL